MYKLDEGIYFEDTGELLKWGKSSAKIAETVKCSIDERGDRTVYRWGWHTILNGLKVPLENMYWLGDKHEFNSIEFKTVGDRNSKKYLEEIHSHLTNLFGSPSKVVLEEDPEGKWTWTQGNVEITLDLFEQHAFKLFLSITRKLKNVL